LKTPTARELEDGFLPARLKDLPPETLIALREHSKRMFGNQDRLEVAVAITRVETGRVNATDLHRDIDVAVNRIRSQLLVMEKLRLLRKVGVENGKRLFERCDEDDLFWKFVVNEYEMVAGEAIDSPADPLALDRRKGEKIS
jgi:hypothetical protein